MRILSVISLIVAAWLLPGDTWAQDRSAEWAEWQVCVDGRVDKCSELGNAYAQGKGKPKDIVLATVFLALACDSAGKSCFQLGQLTGGGEGYSREDGRRVVRAWWDCRQKSPQACFVLGEIYRTAKTGSRMNNPTSKMNQILGLTASGLTAEDAEKLCSTGPPTNCTKRAAMSFLGKGAPADREMALRFLDQACNLKERTACDLQVAVRNEAILRGRYNQNAVEHYTRAIELDPAQQQSRDALEALDR